MQEPISLESIYTTVRFLDDDVQRFDSVENLEESYRKSNRRQFQSAKSEKQDGLKVANQKQYLMVLGQPGAGKSTFLKRLGLAALKGEEYQHPCIPALIELKRFITGNISLERIVEEELNICGFPEPARSTRRLLERGGLLILLDGLDEVPIAYLDNTIRNIKDFIDLHAKNRFIVSCRIAAYRNYFQRFSDVIIADFEDEQIYQFICNWFSSPTDQTLETAKRCWSLLQHPDFLAARELAQSPLLLTFLCLVFDDSQTFPQNRSVLYRESLDILLKK